MRFAITVSNILSLTKPKSYKPLTTKDVFFMATLGGAQGNISIIHSLFKNESFNFDSFNFRIGGF